MTKPIRILGRTVWIVLMTVISLLFAYPFLYSILGSLMLKEDFGNMGTLLPIPQQVTFKNFAYVFSVDGGIAPLVNSLQRAVKISVPPRWIISATSLVVSSTISLLSRPL